VEGHLRCGLIPHFCERRPVFAPIHARAETVAEKEWFSDAYRRLRCIVPMGSFFQKNGTGKRYAISRRDGGPFSVAGILGELACLIDAWGSARSPSLPFRKRTHRADPRPHAGDTAERTVFALVEPRSGSAATCWCRSRQTSSRLRRDARCKPERLRHGHVRS
jgi:hypothetical protein